MKPEFEQLGAAGGYPHCDVVRKFDDDRKCVNDAKYLVKYGPHIVHSVCSTCKRNLDGKEYDDVRARFGGSLPPH
jgi:hypothetical protein